MLHCGASLPSRSPAPCSWHWSPRRRWRSKSFTRVMCRRAAPCTASRSRTRPRRVGRAPRRERHWCTSSSAGPTEPARRAAITARSPGWGMTTTRSICLPTASATASMALPSSARLGQEVCRRLAPARTSPGIQGKALSGPDTGLFHRIPQASDNTPSPWAMMLEPPASTALPWVQWLARRARVRWHCPAELRPASSLSQWDVRRRPPFHRSR